MTGRTWHKRHQKRRRNKAHDVFACWDSERMAWWYA